MFYHIHLLYKNLMMFIIEKLLSFFVNIDNK
ncbi:Uncharacterised protein [Yersinia kristensenii]|nr:Uncharacterised protein [Yersinia kristensenii]CNH61897.1 Uncharacterised protein [Yersinia kristensenii]CNK82419.1 Uncharacterised protein [Yersinia kristensenii]CNL38962.1 Uncharacterised protein [Yersinia kristensenii]